MANSPILNSIEKPILETFLKIVHVMEDLIV